VEGVAGYKGKEIIVKSRATCRESSLKKSEEVNFSLIPAVWCGCGNNALK
jgi:hypothetical protein